MRKVMVSVKTRFNTDSKQWDFEEREAVFHAFGLEAADEINYSVAIIEWPDGKVDLVMPNRVRFVDPLGSITTGFQPVG